MTSVVEHARDILEGAGYRVVEVRALPTGYGSQLRCETGEIAVAYSSGKIVPQGKNAAVVKALFDAAPPPAKPAQTAKQKTTASAAGADADVDREEKPRLPPNWTTAPWDGVTPPF